jgi:hypothetical protein
MRWSGPQCKHGRQDNAVGKQRYGKQSPPHQFRGISHRLQRTLLCQGKNINGVIERTMDYNRVLSCKNYCRGPPQVFTFGQFVPDRITLEKRGANTPVFSIMQLEMIVQSRYGEVGSTLHIKIAGRRINLAANRPVPCQLAGSRLKSIDVIIMGTEKGNLR